MNELVESPNPDEDKPRTAVRRCDEEHPVVKELKCKRERNHDYFTRHWGVYQQKGYSW